MKKLGLITLLWILSLNFWNALAQATTVEEMCEDIWWDYIVLESYPVQERCMIEWEDISWESLKDKYNHYINWMMINYVDEYKYSNASNWNSYTDFLESEINDLKAFAKADINNDIVEEINYDIRVYENMEEYSNVKMELWERNANLLEKALDMYADSYDTDEEKQLFYQLIKDRLEDKIDEMQYTQMVASFTPEGYSRFLLKMNAYKYLLILVNARIE